MIKQGGYIFSKKRHFDYEFQETVRRHSRRMTALSHGKKRIEIEYVYDAWHHIKPKIWLRTWVSWGVEAFEAGVEAKGGHFE